MSGNIDFYALNRARLAGVKFTGVVPTSVPPNPTVTLLGWAMGFAYKLVTKTVANDGTGFVTGGSVLWPDGTTGSYTVLIRNLTFGNADSYQLTYGIVTITQPTVTRDAYGNAIVEPPLVLS